MITAVQGDLEEIIRRSYQKIWQTLVGLVLPGMLGTLYISMCVCVFMGVHLSARAWRREVSC